MKANAKAGVFQGEMASPFLLAERPLGQVGRSIREVKVIMAITDELAQLREQTLARIAEADTSAALESVRVAVLGKAGTLTGYLRGMGKVAKEERAVVGKTVNEVRNVVEEALEARKKKLAAAEMEAAIDASAVDVTLPGRAQQMGTRHLINAITDEVSEIFLGLGYTVVHGPEVETDYYNFEALNAPKDHPSRSMQDTFYVCDLSGEASSVRGESDVLLRTQTSGVQVHVMEDQKPPIYIIAPGKVYRRDVADPSHLPQFTQIEGLVIDKGISFGDLKGTLDYFCKQMFGPDRKLPCALLPVHRALRRGRRLLRRVRRHGTSARRRALPHVQGHGVAGNPRLRHGRPERAHHVGHRPGGVFRLRIRRRRRARGVPEVQRARPAHAPRRRHALPAPVLNAGPRLSSADVRHAQTVLTRTNSPLGCSARAELRVAHACRAQTLQGKLQERESHESIAEMA